MATQRITYNDKSTGDQFRATEATEIKTVVNNNAGEIDTAKSTADDAKSTADTAVQPGDLSTVATSGNYGDLNNIPTSFPPDTHTHDDRYYTESETDALLAGRATTAQGDKADTAVQPGDLADVATSGDYTDLSEKPTSFPPDPHNHPVGDIQATGTPDGTSFLRGDGTWSVPPGTGHTQNTDTSLDQGGTNQVSASELRTHLDDDTKHREINDSSTSATSLWSSQKTSSELSNKATSAQGAKADTAVQPAAISDFETSSELNTRDTANRNRANHTGTQPASSVSGLATVATSGDYNDLTNKPSTSGHAQNTDIALDQGNANEVTAVSLRTHLDDANKHREINDAATSSTGLWSSQKTSNELSGKADTSHTHTKSQISDFSDSDYATAAQGAAADAAKTKTDFITITGATNLDTIRSDSHSHANKSLLDTYSQTEANLADAVSKKHEINKDVALNFGGANQVLASEIRPHLDDDDKHREINDSSTSAIGLWSSQRISNELSDKVNSSALSAYQQSSEKGSANGYAGLDGSSKVPFAQLPILDEDDMASNSAIHGSSQQSIKSFVDGKTLSEYVDTLTTATLAASTTIYRMLCPAAWNGKRPSDINIRTISQGSGTGSTSVQLHNATQSVDHFSTAPNIEASTNESNVSSTPFVVNSGATFATDDLLEWKVTTITSTAGSGLLVRMEIG